MLMELIGEQGDPARPVPWRLTGADRRRAAAGRHAGRPRRSRRGAAAPRPGDPAPAAPGLRRPCRRAGSAHRAPRRARSAVRAGGPVIVPAVAVPVGALLLAARKPHRLRLGGRRTRRVPQRSRRSSGRRMLRRRANAADDDPRHPARRRRWSPPSARYRSRRQPAGPPCPGRRAPRRCWRPPWRPGTAAALAQIAVRTVVPALVGAVVAAVLTAAAAVARLQFDVPVPVIAAVVAATALSRRSGAARALTLRLSGLPRPVVAADAAELVAADTGPDVLPPAELAARARLARAELAGLSGGCAVVAAIAAPLAATGGWAGWTGPALAAAVAAVLLPACPRVRRSGDRPGPPGDRLGGRSRAGRPRRRSPPVRPVAWAAPLILLGAAGITIATGAVRRPPARPWPAGPWTWSRASSPRPWSRSPSRRRACSHWCAGCECGHGGRRGAGAARPVPRAPCATRPLHSSGSGGRAPSGPPWPSGCVCPRCTRWRPGAVSASR